MGISMYLGVTLSSGPIVLNALQISGHDNLEPQDPSSWGEPHGLPEQAAGVRAPAGFPDESGCGDTVEHNDLICECRAHPFPRHLVKPAQELRVDYALLCSILLPRISQSCAGLCCGGGGRHRVLGRECRAGCQPRLRDKPRLQHPLPRQARQRAAPRTDII